MAETAGDVTDQRAGEAEEMVGDPGRIEDAGGQDEKRDGQDRKAVEAVHHPLDREVHAHAGVIEIPHRDEDHRHADRHPREHHQKPPEADHAEDHGATPVWRGENPRMRRAIRFRISRLARNAEA